MIIYLIYSCSLYGGVPTTSVYNKYKVYIINVKYI